MPDMMNKEEIKLYPNPSKSSVNIFWPSQKSYTLLLKDVHGNRLLERKDIIKNPIDLNLENYSSGIYFVYFTTDKNSFVKRLIIK